ncbi:hypothetical protein AQI95_17080 [Streptomyces yokosukanensis]|uniref:Uncharacterized protein n=1 Tax=Streptomyces yokosukanensis TaxID=67386 RepID=A0A101P595_9ACTN|nr:hypothetical protein [Streptomyces yokosukanensis]KUN05193.1 hypothetical protein AQI95_17080 [Streptomyces yokosukanensis]
MRRHDTSNRGAPGTTAGLLGDTAHARAVPAPDAAVPSPATATAPAPRTGGSSANGWEVDEGVEGRGAIRMFPVAGTGLTVALRHGDPAAVLLHVVRRFHHEIDALGGSHEELSVQGWIPPARVRDSGMPESNQASGTAVAIRPAWYPPGHRDAFTPDQVAVVRDILADTDGVVRWGGDDWRPYEGLFYLATGPDDGRITRVADRIRVRDENEIRSPRGR